MKRLRRSLLLPLLLSACASQHLGGPPPVSAEDQAPHLKPEEIHVDLIRQMIDKGDYYAALAHIEDQKRSSGGSDELTLLEADTRRHLDQQPQADTLYRKLLTGRYAAQAYHGLGRLYVDKYLEIAIGYLRAAVQRAPTDVDFRNDLGYALMESGRYSGTDGAELELSTAAQLAPNQLTSRNNLIILMILERHEPEVTQLAQESAVTPERLQQLRDTAQSIRDKQKAQAAKPAH